MNEQKIMNIEAFNEIIENFEIVGKLTEYGRKNIKYHVKRLQKENQQLKEQLETSEIARKEANKIILECLLSEEYNTLNSDYLSIVFFKLTKVLNLDIDKGE